MQLPFLAVSSLLSQLGFTRYHTHRLRDQIVRRLVGYEIRIPSMLLASWRRRKRVEEVVIDVQAIARPTVIAKLSASGCRFPANFE